MRLRELTDYAEKKYQIKEEFKWADYPDFSVLTNPRTGKWAALLIRSRDRGTDALTEFCDLRCGRQTLTSLPFSYLTAPYRMHGQNWIGVRFTEKTDAPTVLRLFDKAMQTEETAAHTIVLEDPRAMDITPSGMGQRQPGSDTEQRQSVSAMGQGQSVSAMGQRQSVSAMELRPPASGMGQKQSVPGADQETSASNIYRDTPLPARWPGYVRPADAVPEKIRSMKKLYEYGSGSFHQKCRNFCRQGVFMQDYEDHTGWEEYIPVFFPVYHDLNTKQLRGYFSWRTFVRKGEYKKAPSAYVYLYLYELLNGIGASSALDSLQKMKAFENGYVNVVKEESSLRSNLQRWMHDLAVLKAVPPEEAEAFLESDADRKDRCLAILRSPEERSHEEIFDAVAEFVGKNLLKSPVLSMEKGKRLFAEVWKKAAADYSRDGKDLFTLCFGSLREFPWNPLGNAVYWEQNAFENREYRLNECRIYRCRDGAWTEKRYERLFFNMELFRSLFHLSDGRFRRYLRAGRPLQEKDEEQWALPFVEAVIAEDRKAEIEAARPKITIDLGGLDQIRRDAAITRDSLLTEEEMQELSGLETEQLIYKKQEEQTADRQQLDPERLARGEDTPGQSEAPETSVDAEGTPGRSEALEKSAVAEEESEQTFIPGNTGVVLVPGLDDVHSQILRDLLQDKPVDAFIRSNLLMPSIVADTINEAFYDEIGDAVIACDDDRLSLVEDYREDLKEILQME